MSPDGFLLSARPWKRIARSVIRGLNESLSLDFNLLKIRGWTRIWMDSRLGSLKCLSGRLRVAAANHRIRRPGRCGIRSIRRRDPGIRESSRAHGLKRMELRSCRGDPSRPTSPLPPSISFSLFPRGYRRCAAEFYSIRGRRRARRLWVLRAARTRDILWSFFWTHFAKDRIINCYWGVY